MASYVTPDQVRAVCMPEGGDRDTSDKATPAAMSDAALGVAIEQAQTIVDGYICRAVALPFVGRAPPLVATLTAWEAAYLAILTLRRTKDLEKDDPFRLRHVQAEEMLKQIAKGEIEIPGTSPPDDAASQGAAYNPYEGNLWLPQDFDLNTPPEPSPRFV